MAKKGYREIRGKRGVFGYLLLWLFVGFNVLMGLWLFYGMRAATEGYDQLSGAEQTGAAIGTGIGFFMIIIIWAVGDVILGIPVLLTRPSKTLVPSED